MHSIFSILDYGACPKASACDNAAAIQKAVDAAHASGGGTVLIPAGRFATASFILKSHVTLHVERGAELIGSSDWKDYPIQNQESIWRSASLIYAQNAQDIAIEGEGRIDGQGQDHIYFPHPEDPLRRRPFLVLLWKCQNIRLQDITLDNPAFFTFMAEKSEHILAERVKIHSWQTENGDGLDFDASSHVVIRDCYFETGDDAISPKTHYPGWPCEDYLISGCYVRSVWAAFRPGTETTADIRNITLCDCCFENCNDGVKIQNCGPGVLENMTIRRVVMKDVHRPLFVTINPFRMSRYETSIRPQTGGIRHILLEDITASQPEHGAEYQRNCMVLSGDMEHPIEDFTLKNCQFFLRGPVPQGAPGRTDVPEYLDYTTIYADIFSIGGGFPACGLYARHLESLTLENCSWISLSPDNRPLLFISDAQRVKILQNQSCGDSPTFVQAAESSITLKECIHNARPFLLPASLSEEEEAKYSSMKACSLRTLETIKALAQTVDSALALPRMTKISPCDFSKDGALWQMPLKLAEPDCMLLLKTFGNVEVFVNGTSVGECKIEKPYRDVILWACNLKGAAVSGDNTLILKWEDPTDHGGMVSELPFGAFEEKQVGVWSLEIRMP